MNTPRLHAFPADPRRLSCAHAVLHAWARRHGAESITPKLVAALESARPAPGLCGAFAALLQLAPRRRKRLAAAFSTLAGDTRCRDLERADTHPCAARIDAALATLESESRRPD